MYSKQGQHRILLFVVFFFNNRSIFKQLVSTVFLLSCKCIHHQVGKLYCFHYSGLYIVGLENPDMNITCVKLSVLALHLVYSLSYLCISKSFLSSNKYDESLMLI